ncbi:hypothetical protein JM658_16680 [Joostella atrarenae]|uniref:Uncharacterized protein n=1 Tax=Joostella atrarenae TaxID=679257 RepID=A0ABS9J7R2_9FLAO|nr:hypothetical protein [Joostella atrarenae]MCF8716464.1 hypothetical protein [Joostella atrarenae]
MKNETLFDEKYINLFSPDGIEFIYSILQSLGYLDFKSSEAREKSISVIERLFELDLIEIFHWGDYQNMLKDRQFTTSETITHIKKVWFVGADFSDFYRMPMFKFKEWYLNSLREQGLEECTDWKIFVEEKIGSLEQWIEENRPKD